MIVLDTNILSELIRPAPAQEVKNWLLHGTEGKALVTTVITVFEMEYGLSRLTDGHRRKELEKRFAELRTPAKIISHFGCSCIPSGGVAQA